MISLDGKILGQLAPKGGVDARLSPNTTHIAFSNSENAFSSSALLVFDLVTQTTTEIPVGSDCVHPSWGGDEQTLVVECRNLFVISLHTGTQSRLLAEQDPELTETSPEWSPDSKWIAYYKGVSPFPSDGPYLVNAACLIEISTCNLKTHRLTKLIGVLTWSPDSRYVAIGPSNETEGNTISIFDIQTGELSRTLKVDLGYGPISTMSWSPDGKWIAFTPRDANGIFLVPADGGTPHLLYSDNVFDGKQVVFWLNIP